MATGKIYIGTSGWSYKHWKGSFYPPRLQATNWLSFYADIFTVAEINTSFYYLPKEQTVVNWGKRVPEGFKFCPKISRYITHMKKLRDPEEPVQRFFNVLAPIKHLLGPVLVQLPPALAFNPAVATYFFRVLNEYEEYSFVLEVRHHSWLGSESLDLLKKHNIGFVISQSELFPYAEIVTSKNIYARFHGPRELYASEYSTEMLQEFAQKFKTRMEEGCDIWVFFNNDIHGHAFRDAQRLKDLMQ